MFDHKKGKALRLIGNGIVEVDFTDGVRKQYDMKQLFSKYPFMKRLVEEEGFFEQGKMDCEGWGIIWDDMVDISIEEIYYNGEDI